MKLLMLFLIFSFEVVSVAVTPKTCHDYCKNPNSSLCMDSGSNFAAVAYPFKDILKAIPDTGLNLSGVDVCERKTVVDADVVKNSGKHCKLQSKPWAFQFFVELQGDYEAQLSDGIDDSGKKVKQVEFNPKHFPDFYAIDLSTGKLEPGFGTMISSITYNDRGMLLGTDDEAGCILVRWEYLK